ncbi:MAG TPA: hypothetical protein VF268_06780 [Gammaproteobacteria bacterium]
MQHMLSLVLALLLAGCGDGAITHVPGENHETVMVAVDGNGSVFLSTGNSPISLQELPNEIESLLGSGQGYSFVIQSEDGSGPLAKQVEEILHRQGVEERHVAIAHQLP